jgi:4-hydroxybenzoate polyprenyltransferase
MEFFRISDVIKWSAISFGGFILGLASLDLDDNIIPFFVFLVSTFCIMSFTFAINNFYDADSDRENPRRKNINAIASGRISKHSGVFLIIILAILPLIFTILFKFEIFVFCSFLLFLGWAYSARPFRFKGRLVMDIIWHFLGFFFYVIWGSYIAGSIGLISWLAAISIGAFSLVGQVENHIFDYSFDKESKTKTLAVWLGLNKTKIILKLLTVLHLILLIPLILLYTIGYYLTIISTVFIAASGLIFLKQKKDVLSNQILFVKYSTYTVGGAVYLSCLIYKILFLLEIPTLSLLTSIGFL